MSLQRLVRLRPSGQGSYLALRLACAVLLAEPGLAQAPSANAPLSLSDVLTAVQRQHPLVDAARARARASRGLRTTAGTLPDPVVTYQVENARWPGSGAVLPDERETSVFATLPLEPLFQRWSRLHRASEDVRAADADVIRTTRDVALDAARAYFRVALAQLSVAGALEWRDGLEQLIQYNRARVAEGVTAEGDLIRVEVERDRAAAAATMERVELLRARAELGALLGRSAATVAGESLLVVVETATAASAIGDLEPYIARARQQRPELLAARSRAAAARSETAYQRTLTVRQIGATFGAKNTAGTQTLLAGISAPLPLFDRNRGEIQRASAERDAAEFEAAWVERRVVAELAAAHEVTRILAAQVASLGSQFLERAQTSHQVTLAAYQDGAAPLLHAIDAGRTLTEARLMYYRTVFAHRVSQLELNVLSGADPLTLLEPGAGNGTAALISVSRDGGRP